MQTDTIGSVEVLEVAGRHVKLVPVPGRPSSVTVFPARAGLEFSFKQVVTFTRRPYLEFDGLDSDEIAAHLHGRFCSGALRLVKVAS